MAQLLSNEFGLSLFGFDVIFPLREGKEGEEDYASGVNTSSISESDESHEFPFRCNGQSASTVHSAAPPSHLVRERELLVVDVNFFPSYKEVKDFPARLRAFLRRKAGLEPWIVHGDEDL